MHSRPCVDKTQHDAALVLCLKVVTISYFEDLILLLLLLLLSSVLSRCYCP